MFGTLGGPELFLILVVALIVFGPRKLPDIGKSVGRMMAEFRKASNDFKRTIEDEVEAEKLRDATRIDVPSWSASDAGAPPTPALPEASPDRAAYDALPPGGAFIAVEALIDNARRENVFGLLMSLNMLIEFGDAFDYSAADFEKWCREIGFKRFEVIPLAGPSSAAIAYK